MFLFFPMLCASLQISCLNYALITFNLRFAHSPYRYDPQSVHGFLPAFTTSSRVAEGPCPFHHKPQSFKRALMLLSDRAGLQLGNSNRTLDEERICAWQGTLWLAFS